MPEDRCKTTDFGVFLLLWNATQNLETPRIHFRIGSWLQRCWERGETRLALQAFRGCGKSTLTGLFAAWLLLKDPDLRILVLSAESTLAEKTARTVRKIIEAHPLTRHLRPADADDWASDSFTVSRARVTRDPSMLARGLYANITGSRADIILCDDVEVPNTCDTAEKRERLRERLIENDFILSPGGTLLYLGTPHSYFSIYADEARAEIGEEDIFLKDFRRLTVPILDEHGKSTWPERFDADEVARIRARAGPLKFASQMMLKPVSLSKSRLDVSLLCRYADAIERKEVQRSLHLSLCGRRLVSASAWWDPAFGSASGDASVLAVVFSDDQGDKWLHRMEYIRVTAGKGTDEDEATLQCRIVADIARDFCLPMVAVETNGIGKFLPAILRRELAKAGAGCSVLEMHSNRSKESRILEAFDAIMAGRRLHVHTSVFDTRFPTEMAEWNPAIKNNRDDGLDAASGAILLEPIRLPRVPPVIGKLWSGSGSGHAAHTDFDI